MPNDTPDGWSEAAAAKQSEALQGLRLQIDAVDRELLALLNRRASLSLEGAGEGEYVRSCLPPAARTADSGQPCQRELRPPARGASAFHLA
ncbi:MAG: hypothetical protein ACLTTU_02415 [Bilophila wadsworthia]